MEMTPEKAIAALLTETNVLSGVFDEAWPTWYAAYLLDHGLAAHLPGAESLDVANLAAMLARLAADYERGDKASPWPNVNAREIVAGFRGSAGGEESAPAGSPEVQTLQTL